MSIGIEKIVFILKKMQARVLMLDKVRIMRYNKL